MNPALNRLQPYPFEKLARLREGIVAPAGKEHINLSIGEPKHPTPSFIAENIIAHLHGTASYPTTRGSDELRGAIAAWLMRRFALPPESISPDRHVLPVNGTREALFAFAQCVLDRSAERPLVLMPNPFYQIYEGAALLAGAEPWYINCQPETGLPDVENVPEQVWARCQLLYICSPGNPTGAVMAAASLERLLELADAHDFVIAADECYSEIYPEDQGAPVGLLEVSARCARPDFRRCMVFHSLSKRSNAPGMRSGFVAGDPDLIKAFALFRTYHGCTMAPYTQAASAAAWMDEEHVRHNRRLYDAKFDAVLDILRPVLEVSRPDAGFYLWPSTPVDDQLFARGLMERQNVTVLPGSFLAREAEGVNPGSRRVRIALVPALEECVAAAQRIVSFTQSL